ncbi:phosphoribosylformylglycinamidine synthase subunit PurQ [Fodinicurvata sp. EGI_FJ10296]|uniref:phosphoribosylformylglycinamidine synthase subunit PurQ n=1 Tax=Fodinicurvata sp. EGI_FJ10296 TaxID=3231908 RepID=UPI0034545ABD
MKSAVIVFPASNCDRDAADAMALATGHRPTMVWHRDTELPPADLIVLPGGFAYGDYLRSGAMAARSPIMQAIHSAAGRGVPILGICNGFQVLVEAGLLPGALMRNAGLRFVHRMVHLSVERNDTPFTQAYDKGQVIEVPVAHHDGRYFAESATLDRVEGDGLVAFRYVDSDGRRTQAANPNGSLNDIAGIFNPTHRILGMMPHPERVSDPAVATRPDGMALFRGIASVAA